MLIRQPRYSKEEFARRGHEIYESQIRSQVEEGNYGRIVAIDIETGAFEVADDGLKAAKQLLILIIYVLGILGYLQRLISTDLRLPSVLPSEDQGRLYI